MGMRWSKKHTVGAKVQHIQTHKDVEPCAGLPLHVHITHTTLFFILCSSYLCINYVFIINNMLKCDYGEINIKYNCSYKVMWCPGGLEVKGAEHAIPTSLFRVWHLLHGMHSSSLFPLISCLCSVDSVMKTYCKAPQEIPEKSSVQIKGIEKKCTSTTMTSAA